MGRKQKKNKKPKTNQRNLSHFYEFKEMEIENQPKIDSSPMDPFLYLHDNVHKLVMQHFAASDILQMSLVSPEWSQMIESPSNLSKVHFNLQMIPEMTLSDKQKALDACSQSWRKYVNAKIAYDAGTQLSALMILRKSADTLKSLEIGEIFGINKRLEEQEFKQLKHLDVGFVSQSVFDFMFSNHLQLETLIFNKAFSIYPRHDKIARFLTTQTGLKKLHVICDNTRFPLCFIINLEEMNQRNPEMHPVPFKLKELIIGSNGNVSFDPLAVAVNSLIAFIGRHKESMEKLVLMSVIDRAIVNYIFNEMQVKAFSMRVDTFYHSRVVDAVLALNVNQALVELRIGKGITNHEIRQIILASPNLILLGLENLRKNSIEAAAENLSKLRVLEFCAIEKGGRKRYDTLKKERDDGTINKDIILCFCRYDIIAKYP